MTDQVTLFLIFVDGQEKKKEEEHDTRQICRRAERFQGCGRNDGDRANSSAVRAELGVKERPTTNLPFETV